MSFPKVKSTPPPAAAPAAADMTVAQQKLGGDEPESNKLKNRRKGRSALRIDLQSGGAGVSPGAVGVNVPSK